MELRWAPIALFCCLFACGPSDNDSEILEDLRPLVREYLSTGDEAVADSRLAEILADPEASIDRLRQLLEEPPVYEPAPVGRLPKVTLTVGANTSDYALWVPENYDPSVPNPTIICLHGAGADGSEYLDAWQSRLGDTFILACPSGGAFWELGGEQFVLGVLDDVASTYNVDPDRTLLLGMSDGGAASYIIGMHNADRFAGVAPMAGGLTELIYDFLSNFFATPLYIIHGSRDSFVPVSASRNVVEYLANLGYSVVYSEHNATGGGHGGGHFFPESELPALKSWLTTRTRQRTPMSLRIIRDEPHLEPLYWSQILETEEIATISYYEFDQKHADGIFAVLNADIADNRIDVTSEFVTRYRLWLNRGLVDFSRPVEVYTNGVQSFSGMIEPSTDKLLTHARMRQDRGQLYTAELDIAVQ